MIETLRRCARAISAWIQTNIVGTPEQSAYSGRIPVQSQLFDEKVHSLMESTEAMPPSPFTDAGAVNPRSVEFGVKKVVEGIFDLVISGLMAAFLWFVARISGRKFLPESDNHRAEAMKTLLPFAVWVVCFVILFFRRRFASPKPPTGRMPHT